MSTQAFSVATPRDYTVVIDYILSQPVAANTAQIITLVGDLGAGKTTFTQQLARQLGITEPVVSPTFVVMKSYQITDHPDYDQLVHIDAYRFEDESEAGPLGLAELFTQPRTLICLEWPERIAGILPKEKVEVEIEIGEGEEREVVVSG